MMFRSLIVGFWGLVLVACGHAQQSVSLYEAGDYAGAARAADDGLAQHPKDEGLWQMRVRAALAQGDSAGLARAYHGYKQAIGEDDKDLVRELAIATLEAGLQSPSAKMKIVAIQAIEAAELQDLADAVAQKMEDKDDRVVAAAAIAILRGGYVQAPEVAEQLLASESAEARAIIIDGLGKKAGILAADDLEKAATDPDPRVRRIAIRWLGQMKDQDAVALLMRRMRDPDEAVRAASATALARIGVGNLESLGTQALKDRALAVRLAGIDLLAAAKRVDRLVQVAESDPDPMVAAEAAIAAKRSDLAIAAVQKAAQAELWTMRAGAANLATRAFGRDKARPFLLGLAEDKDVGVRLSAARALAHAGDKATAIAVFTAALADPERALSAAQDLASLGDPRGITLLDEAARDTKATPDARSAAVAAHRGARKITGGLVAALADASGLVRVEAAAVLLALSK
ncbi:MAG: HEAT repeat domain-containing protein [Kofleriaceae bacterium]